jgi:flagellar protein FlaJ
MSNNIKAGLTPFKALKLSARKEFGALSEEINNAINKSFGSNSFTKVLLEINTRIKSVMLERVLKLQASSISTGNNMAGLLDDLAKDIRETRMLRNDLVTKTKTYTAFILFTVLFGTPTLLSISIHFVTMISGFSAIGGSTSTADAAFDVGFSSGAVAIQPAFLIIISFAMLILTALLASMLLGVIMKGKMTSGFKYAPALIIGVVVIFMFSRFVVSTFFGSML